MRYYLGIDGGGTKTDAALCDETGRVAARALGPAGNLVDIGVPAYGALLGELLDGLAQQTGGALPPVAAAFAGLSGGSDQKIAAACRQLLQDRLPATPLVAGGDDRQSLLAGGLYGADGCVLISGTGCACTARVNGRLHSIGGWGFLFDGRGGGFDIGRDAVMAALRALDGRGEPTLLRRDRGSAAWPVPGGQAPDCVPGTAGVPGGTGRRCGRLGDSGREYAGAGLLAGYRGEGF